ncbi:MAG: glycosyltransferase family 4 protein, partial [Bacteroidota bacterium]
EKFDVIQLEGVYLSQYVTVIRKYSKAKIVLRTQNVEFEIWERESVTSSFPKSAYLKLMAKRMKQFELSLLNQYDAIVPVSKRDAQSFKQLGCNIPMQVCEHGVDTSAVTLSLSKSENFSVFHIGSMDWRANLLGLEWFLENCWQNILKEIPEAKLYLAGRNFPNEWKQKKIHNVVMVGEVENATAFINSKQVMIVPLHAGSGIRVKLMEGMSLGKAIVSTSIGAEGLPVENGKNIFIADEATEFSQTVIGLLKDNSKRIELEKEARALAEKEFDYRKLVGDLLNFYSNLVKT